MKHRVQTDSSLSEYAQHFGERLKISVTGLVKNILLAGRSVYRDYNIYIWNYKIKGLITE